MIEQIEKIGILNDNKLFDLNILDKIITNQKEKRNRRDSIFIFTYFIL
jgi:hypothetical protein